MLATFDHSRKQTRSDVIPCVEQEYDHLNDSGDEEQQDYDCYHGCDCCPSPSPTIVTCISIDDTGRFKNQS